MDEDISIINTNTRNEKIKNFFFKNKKKIISSLGVIIILLISYFDFISLLNNIFRVNINIDIDIG